MPEKRIVIWSADARAELLAIDRETALCILQSIDRYVTTGERSGAKRHIAGGAEGDRLCRPG